MCMEPVRACPVCPQCGTKRFVRIHQGGDKGDDTNAVTVKCRLCGRVIRI